jgi:sulfate adenylyltransferase large subunit
MNANVQVGDSEFEALPQRQAHNGLLRFIACGSVDHGKSTLIGRLLYESKQLFEDQLDALARDSRKFGTQGDELDFALLVDGLAAEREQKITIDVAYRFFATARRKFIVIDAPGHEQYTGNMATGASVADLALLLVSADEGLTRQTKRHALVLSMLGVRDVVLAVNKMDRIGWSESAFRTLEKDFQEFAAALGIDRIVAIPLAAKSGDNVMSRSAHMPWYGGPSLLEYLEEVEPVRAPQRQSFRMPIQWVSRPNADFRGYSGLIARGQVHAGMAVKVLPSGRVTRIARIATFDGDLERAATGRSVTLTFADHVDASRGDVVVGIEAAPTLTDRIAARLFWIGSEPIEPGRRYLLKLATTTVAAKIEPDVKVFDLDARRLIAAAAIAHNEIGLGTLTIDRPIAVDRYAECKDTGSFILIDPETYDTVGMGCVEGVIGARSAAAARKRTAVVGGSLARWTETHARSLAKAVSWRATGSLDTFVVAFVITANPKIAGSVAVTEILTKIAIYYLHERVWALVPWGKRQPDTSSEPQHAWRTRS